MLLLSEIQSLYECCPLMKEAKQRMKKKHHAHVAEDDEPVRKKEEGKI